MSKNAIKPVYADAGNGIWVGNAGAATEVQFLADADITAIINLSGKSDPPVEDVDYFDYALPSQELMDTEFPKTITKLEAIMSDIKDLRNNNRNVLIHCLDGKNKCMLAAAYYLITQCGRNADQVIDSLEQMYFTADQKRDEQEAKQMDQQVVSAALRQEDQTEGIAFKVDQEIAKKRDERNAVRCLTIASFKRILRLRGKK